MQLSLLLWLLVLLGINRKIKCFPAVVFACHGNVHTPHWQHLYAAQKTCYLVGAVHCEAKVSLRAEWSQAYFHSLFKRSPSQLDALRLAALQLDTGSLSLWTSSFLVPGGHYMPSLLKACLLQFKWRWRGRPGNRLASRRASGADGLLETKVRSSDGLVAAQVVNSKSDFILQALFILTNLIRDWLIN